MKTCTKCNEEKDLGLFPKGRSSFCKVCKNAQTQEWRKRNQEKLKADRAAYYEKNKDKELSNMRKWKEKNREHSRNYSKVYAKSHKAERTALQMKRHVKKVSTEILKGDEWNGFVLQEIYELSQIRSGQTNIKWHVDHIVSLQGRLVTGLHVWYNLQLLPASVNCSKGNSF